MTLEKEIVKMYFIAVVLPKHLDEKVVAYKHWIKEHYGSKVGLKSPAHLTLVPPFWMAEAKEQRLVLDLATLAQNLQPFTLTTDDFSAFKPKTIFIAIEPNQQLQLLKKATDDFFRHSDYPFKLETRPFHPHITIATRDLSKKDFNEAWPHFRDRPFKEPFDANGLSLLKHNGRTWDVPFTAPFGDAAPAGFAGPW